MLNPQDDRALRRLITELETATPTDIEAVLASLDPEERNQIEALLSAYSGSASVAHDQRKGVSAEPAIIHIDGLSPWLAARLKLSTWADANGETFFQSWRRQEKILSGHRDLSMTPTALRALQSSALNLAQRGQVDFQSAGRISWKTVFSRLRQFLRGRLAAS